jgi:hypothetical protein
VNTSDDITLTLHTNKDTDADMFIQRGTNLPTTSSYFMKSVNFESDEITIPKNEHAGMGNKMVYYTVGVFGIIHNCPFTLTAWSNTFKVINYDLGAIVSSTLVNTGPLVLRIPSYLRSLPVRVFFSSMTSGVKLMVAEENEKGIKESIPPQNDTSTLKVELKVTGYPGVYKFQPNQLTEPSSGAKSLLVFYPEAFFGTVSAVVVHPWMPIKYKEGMEPFFFRLEQQENLTIAVSATSSGELDKMKFRLRGSRSTDYNLTFDKR